MSQGFRGIWLFPNLFDDNQTFAGSFQPMGRKLWPMYAWAVLIATALSVDWSGFFANRIGLQFVLGGG